jgi:hypothetical protein
VITGAAAMISVVPLSRGLLDGVLVDQEHAPRRHRCDLGVLPYFSDERPLGGLAGFIDWRCSGAVSDLLRAGFCDGSTGQAVLLPGRRSLPAQRWILLGLGPSAGFTPDVSRDAATRIVDVARRVAPADVLLSMPGRPADRSVLEGLFGGVAAHLAECSRADPDGGVPWWVVAEERHVARLRSVLEGPPRPADD